MKRVIENKHKLSPEQQDFILELIATEDEKSSNPKIVKALKREFGVSVSLQAVNWYRSPKYYDIIIKKRESHDKTIKAKIPLANKLNRIREYANMYHEIDWEVSNIAHFQGDIIAEFIKKDFVAKIRCLEKIEDEMKPYAQEGKKVETQITNTGDGDVHLHFNGGKSDEQLDTEEKRLMRELGLKAISAGQNRFTTSPSDN